MNKLNEYAVRRTYLWEQAKAFLKNHRGESGITDDTEYQKLLKEYNELGKKMDDLRKRECDFPNSHWEVMSGGNVRCSVCERYSVGRTPYCPWCGAKMDMEV